MNKPVCRRCLLSHGDDLYKTLTEHIKALPMEERVPLEEYTRRLEKCQACDHLINGTCTLCGCYVELRAAKKLQRCVKYFW